MNKTGIVVSFFLVILISTSCCLGFVEIIKPPKENPNVSWRYVVGGISSATEESGMKVYLLVWPIEPDGPWEVHPTGTFSDGSWRLKASFGQDPERYPESIGTTYRVIAIIASKTLENYKDLTPNLPQSNRSEEIVVTRTGLKDSN